MLACLLLSNSGKTKEVFGLSVQVISPLAFVTFIRNLPLGKWKGFLDEILISGFYSSVLSW